MIKHIKNFINEYKEITKAKKRESVISQKISEQIKNNIQLKRTCRVKTLSTLQESMINTNKITIEVEQKYIPYFSDSVINHKDFYGYRFIQISNNKYNVIKVGDDLLD